MSTFLNNIEEELEQRFEETPIPNQAPRNSKTNSLPPPRYVPNTSNYTPKPKQRAPAPQRIPQRAPQISNNNRRCQIQSVTYIRLFGFLLFGAGLAVGHHFFYQSLNGQPVSDLTLGVSGLGGFQIDKQQLYLQIGTLIAWIAQGCFAATINTAYNQYAWTIMRAWSSRRGRAEVGVRTLECMFSGSSDLMAFLDPRFLRAAPISWLIAAFIWLMPLTGLFTQATLNVAQSVDSVSTTFAKGSTSAATATSSRKTRYAYKQRTLALSYGISLSFALFWAFVGLICLVKNRGVGYGMRSFGSILATAWRSEIQQGMDQLGKAEQGMREDMRQHVSENMDSIFGDEGWNHNQIGNGDGNPRRGRNNRSSNHPSRDSSVLHTALKSEAERGMAELSRTEQNIRQDIWESMESMLGLEGNQQVKNSGNIKKGRNNNLPSQNSSILATALESEVRQGMGQLDRTEQDIRQDVSENLGDMLGLEARNYQTSNISQGRKPRNNQQSRNFSMLATPKTTAASVSRQEIDQASRAEQDMRQNAYQDVSEDLESRLEVDQDHVENQPVRKEKEEEEDPEVEE